ncbi:PREDICTED: rhodanese-like domain-containing protein 15, chloroplastic [Tarenaya hassleriana]|uniref:rhodanese-like domain-containing protein 15, chloroplastic n=1 Tax=Tarenaya hassleriana TaxID=28532 RepID=UPI00053C5863|nr:PREDICTED: rhodanese-like domain-containing protein 15, chloroplastic [Tarenaya hassleriana]
METTAFIPSSRLGNWPSAFDRPSRLRSWNIIKAIDPRGSNLRTRATRRRNSLLVEEPSRILTSVPVRVAHELAQAGHRYLDVRTPDEFSAGHPSGSINVPYFYRVGSGLTKNPGFLRQVSSHFRKHDEIIIGSESGERSLMASADLLSSGFTSITDIAGGYTAWSQNGLPVED